MRKVTVITLLALTMVAVMVAGCATTGGNKDQKSVEKTLADWKAAVEKQDIDGMLAAYSEEFTSDQGGGKAELKGFLTNVKEQGYLEGAKADLTKAQTKIEKNTATVGPIDLSSNAGALTLQLTLKKDPDKAWRIVASEESS